jgi:hypothetical protein
VPNPDGRLKVDMYADVIFGTGAGEAPVISVPTNAVIDSGERQVVLVAKGEGRFEPRSIKLGRRGDGYVEVLEGLNKGDGVVTSATFLIDAKQPSCASVRAARAENGCCAIAGRRAMCFWSASRRVRYAGRHLCRLLAWTAIRTPRMSGDRLHEAPGRHLRWWRSIYLSFHRCDPGVQSRELCVVSRSSACHLFT